jgi:dinuclear metal center YbgI/SA1388 family protein
MKKNKTTRQELNQYIRQLLAVDRFKDYCPNGLQVQGKNEVAKIISGVTASQALIEEAIKAKADAVIVHHGWFWKNDESPIVGQLHQRLKLLMDHDINLFAYHLPLDQHPKLGNNAQLAKIAGWKVTGQHPMNDLVWLGEPATGIKTLAGLASSLEKVLGRKSLVIGKTTKPVKKIAWCTGAAQGYLNHAIEAGVDVFISGEISEPTFHLAQESGVAYISAGHHATERYGIQALGRELAKKFGIEHQFIDIPNPV